MADEGTEPGDPAHEAGDTTGRSASRIRGQGAAAWVDGAPRLDAPEAPRTVQLLGVSVTDHTMDGALSRLGEHLTGAQTHVVYFVNAHTLNLASRDEAYRDVLNTGDIVFGDGVGVRWAARARGVQLRANLNGTDIVPPLFERNAGRGLRYFLLGATPESNPRAAARAQELFPGWTLAGHHHGYVDFDASLRVIDAINASSANLLLVGMGNPLQEQWLATHRLRLRVPLAMAVGGLFDYWAGSIRRAPEWARHAGLEWAHILAQQPGKFERYVLGNPLFIARLLAWRRRDLKRMP